MNIPLIIESLLVLFGYNFNKPVRLEKDSRTTFDKWCNKIAPYVIFIAIIVLIILIAVILIKYGYNIVGTESNNYYYHMGDL